MKKNIEKQLNQFNKVNDNDLNIITSSWKYYDNQL